MKYNGKAIATLQRKWKKEMKKKKPKSTIEN